MRGLQGDDLANPLAVLACAKHYVGDGGTAFGSARNGKPASTRAIRASTKRLCAAFTCRATSRRFEAGVGSIMPSYSSWNGVKCSGNKHLLTEILKDELGFEGFLISDYNAIDQIDPATTRRPIGDLHQRRHGHGDGARALQGVHSTT